jgi:hypothetical protein
MFYISGISLLIIMSGCLAGIFLPAKYYDDNLLQRLGMSGLFVLCLTRFEQLIKAGELTGGCVPVSAQLCGHVGMALITVGTAWKAYRSYVPTNGACGEVEVN